MKTPFFPGWARLAGRAERSSKERFAIGRKRLLGSLRGQCESILVEALPGVDWTGHDARQRRFPALTAVGSMVHGQLHGGASLRDCLRWWQSERAEAPGSSCTAGLAQARGRVPVAFLESLVERSAQELEARGRGPRRILAVDGTGLSLPDTPANRAAFSPSSLSKDGCGFPVAQSVALFELGHGGVLGASFTPLRAPELPTFEKELAGLLRKGDLLIGDTAYYAYWHLFKRREEGVDLLTPITATMAPCVEVRQPLEGVKDAIVRIRKSNRRPAHLEAETIARLPPWQEARMVAGVVLDEHGEAKRIHLLTTLMDPKRYPRHEILRLYQMRWQAEVNFRALKQSLDLKRLRARTPAMAQRELLGALLTYNLVRLTMQQAALRSGLDPNRVSFTGTRAGLLAFAPRLHAARLQKREWDRLYARMLALLAADSVPHRPGRMEPRKVKARAKKYTYLCRPRSLEKQYLQRQRDLLLN